MQKEVNRGYEMKMRQLLPAIFLFLNFFTIALWSGPSIRVEQQTLNIGAKAAAYTGRNTRIYYKYLCSRIKGLRFFRNFLKSSLAELLQQIRVLIQVQWRINTRLWLKINALVRKSILNTLIPLSRGRIVFSLA